VFARTGQADQQCMRFANLGPKGVYEGLSSQLVWAWVWEFLPNVNECVSEFLKESFEGFELEV